MVTLEDKQIRIDGRPHIVMSGEIHYFRLQRADWADRISKLKAAGCNAVASYVPWLCHEPIQGEVDLIGATQPELDLGAFIDLCHDHGLFFIARPGPFIMAEMKNEGLPYWLYTEHPEIVPVTWDQRVMPSRTVDYLAPGFLAEVQRWYQAVMGVIAPRLQPNGGNVIAVQLDNEIGMLSWIRNMPDLGDSVLADFTTWLQERYDATSLGRRYPFALENPDVRRAALREPQEAYSAELLRDLGHYMRGRFARYVATLRSYAEDCGVTGVPFIINVHGTDRGRGLTYPIGISQLYEAYTQAPGYLAGSDHYLGQLAMDNFQDLYLINALMDAVNTPDQPLASVEFEAGSGDYSGDHGGRHDPATVDFKVRMSIGQGNRLINYYLFSGGVNALLPQPVGDGNDRIAFTGERHGVGAPINPEGQLSYTYPQLAQVTKTTMAVADKLAVMAEEHDALAFAFIPDYYMTESWYPSSVRMAAIVGNLESYRGPTAWEVVARAMLLAGYRFGAIDIQNRLLNAQTTPVLVLPSAQHMDPTVQQKLVDYLHTGGRILLYGEVPYLDMEGHDCTVLADALGLRSPASRQSVDFYYLSVQADGWAAPRAEVRAAAAQTWQPDRGEILAHVVGTDEACGFDIAVGAGRAIVFSCLYPGDISLYRAALEQLGVRAGLQHDHPQHGIFITSTISPDGERFLHLLNLDGFDKDIRITEYGQPLLGDSTIRLSRRAGLMLPLNVTFGPIRILYATAEITAVGTDTLTFRLTQAHDVVVIETEREILPSDAYTVTRQGGTTLITSQQHAALNDQLTLRWR